MEIAIFGRGRGVSRPIMRERMHTGSISSIGGSQEDTTPRRIAVSPPVAALFVSNFPSCRLAPSPIRSGSIVIAVIVIVIRPGIMHNARECAACTWHQVTAVQHHVLESIVSRIFDLSFD